MEQGCANRKGILAKDSFSVSLTLLVSFEEVPTLKPRHDSYYRPSGFVPFLPAALF